MAGCLESRIAVMPIGYHAPGESPKFLGTCFMASDNGVAITCAHVVSKLDIGGSPRIEISPLKINIGGEVHELCCWLFKYVGKDIHFVRMPVKDIRVLRKIYVDGPYYGDLPDVAILELDTSLWEEKYPGEALPYIEILELPESEIGIPIVIMGFPSTDFLVERAKKINCLEPLLQFGRLAGVLPHSRATYPHFYAFDISVAKGSSGSPILDLNNGKVIALVSQLHPSFLPTYAGGQITGKAMVPSGISFGVPSYFFKKSEFVNIVDESR